MQKTSIIAAAVLAISATSATAQGFSGATLGIDYSNYADSDILGSTTYYGAVEADVYGPVGAALDLSGYNFNNFDENGSNATLHLVYNLDGATAFGAYLGQDSVGDVDADIYGIEGKLGFGQTNAEAYLGTADVLSEDVTMLGVDGAYAVTPEIAVIGGFDTFSFEDDRVTSIEIGGQYALANGPEFFATVGNLSSDDDDELFISIGAEINLGEGTTFGRRSLLELLPIDGS